MWPISRELRWIHALRNLAHHRYLDGYYFILGTLNFCPFIRLKAHSHLVKTEGKAKLFFHVCSCGKVMFLHLSVIMFTRGGRHPREDTPPSRCACWEMRATIGRYASYWNAYLFVDLFLLVLWFISYSLLLSLGVSRP